MAYSSAAKHAHPAALDAVVTTLGSLRILFCFLGCLNVSAAAVLPRIQCVAYGHGIHKPNDTMYLVRYHLELLPLSLFQYFYGMYSHETSQSVAER